MSKRRKRLGWRLVGIVAVLVAVGALGPQRRVERFPAGSPALPSDLDAFLAEREQGLGDVRPQCEARIVWADGQIGRRTSVSVVSLHGFSATRQEAAPLLELVAQSLGANLFESRLRGHGRTGAALGKARAEEWLEDGVEALAVGRKLGEQVIVVGVSTGGTLGTWLVANGHAEDVAALLLISPNFGPRDPKARLLTGPWGRQLANLFTGGERGFEPINERQAAYWTTRYPTDALVEMQALVDLAVASDLTAVTTPLLLVHAPNDRVVDPAPMQERFAAAASTTKKHVVFEESADPSHHVLAGDVLSPASTEELKSVLLEFVRPLVTEARDAKSQP
ncbi:MAG: alpha/beta hydrolase [Planctomycetota bacterium]|jgi:esterase/lipase